MCGSAQSDTDQSIGRLPALVRWRPDGAARTGVQCPIRTKRRIKCISVVAFSEPFWSYFLLSILLAGYDLSRRRRKAPY